MISFYATMPMYLTVWVSGKKSTNTQRRVSAPCTRRRFSQRLADYPPSSEITPVIFFWFQGAPKVRLPAKCAPEAHL